MTVLIVGGDNLGNLTQELEEQGCQEIIHWEGRKKAAVKKKIPAKVDVVVVLHDFVSHDLMSTIKEKAKKLKLPMVFSKRSVADIKGKLLFKGM